MGFGACLICIGALLTVAIVLVIWVVRRRHARPDLVIHITAPTIKPVSDRPEWYMDVLAEFSNVSTERLCVRALKAAVSAPRLPLLDSKRILGDEQARIRTGQLHPPDISLRLPFWIEPGSTITYRFHIFFVATLRRMWDSGLLHLHAILEDGSVVEGVRTLTPPQDLLQKKA